CPNSAPDRLTPRVYWENAIGTVSREAVSALNVLIGILHPPGLPRSLLPYPAPRSCECARRPSGPSALPPAAGRGRASRGTGLSAGNRHPPPRDGIRRSAPVSSRRRGTRRAFAG